MPCSVDIPGIGSQNIILSGLLEVLNERLRLPSWVQADWTLRQVPSLGSQRMVLIGSVPALDEENQSTRCCYTRDLGDIAGS